MQSLRSVKCRTNASHVYRRPPFGYAAYMTCRYHDILALFIKVLLHKSRPKTGSKYQSQVSSFCEIGYLTVFVLNSATAHHDAGPPSNMLLSNRPVSESSGSKNQITEQEPHASVDVP